MKVMELNDLAFTIEPRNDLIASVEALRQDLSSDPEGWENASLDDYLDALAAWLEGPGKVYARFDETISRTHLGDKAPRCCWPQSSSNRNGSPAASP